MTREEQIEKLKTQQRMAEDCMNRARSEADANVMAIFAGGLHAVLILLEFPEERDSFVPYLIAANEQLLVDLIAEGKFS